MKNDFFDGFASIEDWMVSMTHNVRKMFGALLPFTQAEKAFMHAIRNGAGVRPELFISNTDLIDVNAIKKHPALLWAEMKSR